MKQNFLIVLILFLSFTTHAQMLTPTVISSTGGFSSNANGSLSYTAGEMTMVQTFTASGNILTQGFQQPNDNITGLLDMVYDDFGSFVIYPNPAVDKLWFGIQMPESGKLEVSLFNAIGEKIKNVYVTNYQNGKITESLAVDQYATGVYVLRMNFVSDKSGATHSIGKKFQIIN